MTSGTAQTMGIKLQLHDIRIYEHSAKPADLPIEQPTYGTSIEWRSYHAT